MSSHDYTAPYLTTIPKPPRIIIERIAFRAFCVAWFLFACFVFVGLIVGA